MDKKERDPQASLLFVKLPDLLFNFFRFQVCWLFDSNAMNNNHLLRMLDYLKRDFFGSKAFLFLQLVGLLINPVMKMNDSKNKPAICINAYSFVFYPTQGLSKSNQFCVLGRCALYQGFCSFGSYCCSSSPDSIDDQGASISKQMGLCLRQRNVLEVQVAEKRNVQQIITVMEFQRPQGCHQASMSQV